MIQIYLTRWQEATSDGGSPLITDPISQAIGPDRVIPGLQRFHRIKAKPDATRRPSKSPCVVFLTYSDGTDTSQIDSELAGLPVFPLDEETLATRIDSINSGRQKKIQGALDDQGIPVTLTDHATIGGALKAVALWLNPDLPQAIRDGLSG